MSQEPIDAEVMPPEKMAVATRPQMAVAEAMGVKEILAQVKLIQDVMRSVMTEGEHYGTIPGCGDKKTLLQPGAQKLTMTFRLAPSYEIQETDLERGHKEFRAICTLRSTGGAFVGQGVGCCSSMESKYRYRGGARKCPECGKEAIIMGKQFKPTDPPPGWLCWKKKGGCGATWPAGDPRIENQSIEKVENENPADTFNTVLKMAKKRAFVDATITATAASDIFTQDVGDDENPEPPSQPPPGPRRGGQTQAGKPAAAPAPRTAPGPAQKTVPLATVDTRGRFLRQWADLDVLKEFLIATGKILDTETAADLPLRWVPVTKHQNDAILKAFAAFENGDPVTDWPFPANPEKAPDKAATPAKPATKHRDPEAWRGIIVPIPPKGVRRDDYLKAPQTVGGLYDDRHDPDTAKRLFGFISHFQPSKTWIGQDGQVHQRSETEIKMEETFRQALDDCKDFHDKHGGDTEHSEGGG